MLEPFLYGCPIRIPGKARLTSTLLVATIAAGLSLPTSVPAEAASAQTGGVTLDGWGGLHPFGGFSLNTANRPWWPNWDIARAVAVRADGAGGWTLDGFGGIHAFGSAAPINTPVYWGPSWDIARAFVVTSRDAGGQLDGRQGYLLDGFGGIHGWGGAPALTGWPYTQYIDKWRGLEIHDNANGVPDGGWEMDQHGSVTAFGAAPAITIPGMPTAPVMQQLHAAGNGGFAVAKLGVVSTYGNGVSPYWNGYADWNRWDILRDIVLVNPTNPTPSAQPVSAAAMADYQTRAQPRGGAVLDGWGGLHPFGGFLLDAEGAPWWPGWDIARAVSLRADGSGGWTLDGFGGIHAFGAAPFITTPVFWQSWDVARAFVVTSRDSDGLADGRQGYLLDGFGGIHAWGGAPALTGWPYTQGQDLWRGLDIHYSANGVPDGGWEIDRWGHVAAFGAAPPLTISGQPNAPVLQQLHTLPGGGYTVARWGIVTTFGSGISPYWSGYGDWGGWDIVRDVAIVNATNPQPTAQPSSAGAATRVAGAANLAYTNAVPLIAQSRNLDCESAALRMALLFRGFDRSEDWILAQMGADLRRAVVDQFGDVLRWGDPYQTFVGNVNGVEYNASGYGVYYPPIATAAFRGGYRWTVGREGWTPRDLYVEVAAGNTVVVWLPVYGYWESAAMRTWTAWDGRAIRYTLVEHAMTLIGINAAAGTVTLNDPNHGVLRTVPIYQFEGAFAKFNNMAVVVD